MAANEAQFDAALADFMTTLDDSLNSIQTKLDEQNVAVDFSDELASLDSAKTKLSDFVAANTTTTGGGTTEPPADTGGGTESV